MLGADPGRDIGDLKRWRNPFEMGIGRKQTIAPLSALPVRFAIGLDQQLGHCDGGSSCRRGFGVNPGKNGVGQRYVFRGFLKVVDKNTGIEREAAVTRERESELVYSQLSRSLRR